VDKPADRRDEDPEEDRVPAVPVAPVPEQRPVVIPEGRKLPYDDGLFVAQHLIVKMPADALELAIRILNRHAEEKGLNVVPENAS
jgi:ParB family chromosome partitioning protein